MNVRKFSASSSRDAWRQVREALGPDAVILSNRTISGMIEILAMAPEDMSSLSEPVVERPALSESTLSAFGVNRPQEQAARPSAVAAVAAPKPAQDDNQAANLADAIAASRDAAPAAGGAELAQVMNELRSMRGMLESQLAEIAWSAQQKREPAKAAVMRELLSAGFSASLARYLTQNLPKNDTVDTCLSWVK